MKHEPYCWTLQTASPSTHLPLPFRSPFAPLLLPFRSPSAPLLLPFQSSSAHLPLPFCSPSATPRSHPKKQYHKWAEMVNFHDSFTSLYDRFFVLSWALCIAGEQWIWGFVTKYQPRAKSFIFTRHNLISLNSHCLVTIHFFGHRRMLANSAAKVLRIFEIWCRLQEVGQCNRRD